MKLTPLKAGDRAEGFGSVVRLVDGLGLKYEDREAGGPPPQEVYAEGRGVARLLHVDGELLGRRCAVSGRWSGSALEVDTFGPMPPVAGAAPIWKGPRVDRPRRPRTATLDQDLIERAWAPLWEAGIVVSRAVDEYGFAHVVTHDLDRAETTLRPVYGDSLLLTASPWTPEVFHHIERLMNIGDHQEVVFMAGGGFEYDAEYDGYLAVTYVTEAIAEAARDIPDGALSVVTLLRPVGTETP